MPNKKPKIHKFMEYYSKPLTRDRILYLNTLNTVEQEKVELYRDFILSLTHLIGDTFLGDDVVLTEEDCKGHFNWCWQKNIDVFKAEFLHFDLMGEHYYYFYKYFYDVFYGNKEKGENIIQKIITFWENIMSIERLKTHNEYDLFINLYKIQTKHFINNFP